MSDEHMPVRPHWGGACGAAEWPEPEARAALLVEFADSRPSLGVYLVGCLSSTPTAFRDLSVGVDGESSAVVGFSGSCLAGASPL